MGYPGKRSTPPAGLLQALLLCAFMAWPVNAAQAQQQQPVCGPRASVLAALAEQFNEKPVARGVTATGMLFEVFASEGGATFTVLLTTPNGRSCLATSGEAWEFIFARPEERES